jgi:hypothetical protein
MSDTERVWVERVLGVKSRPGADDAAGVTALQTLWQRAVSEVDQEFQALANAFVATGSTAAANLARSGLPRLREALVQPVVVALGTLEQADTVASRSAACASAEAAVGALEQMLAGLPDLERIENNPFKLPIKMRKVLAQAAAELRNGLPRQSATPP